MTSDTTAHTIDRIQVICDTSPYNKEKSVTCYTSPYNKEKSVTCYTPPFTRDYTSQERSGASANTIDRIQVICYTSPYSIVYILYFYVIVSGVLVSGGCVAYS